MLRVALVVCFIFVNAHAWGGEFRCLHDISVQKEVLDNIAGNISDQIISTVPQLSGHGEDVEIPIRQAISFEAFRGTISAVYAESYTAVELKELNRYCNIYKKISVDTKSISPENRKWYLSFVKSALYDKYESVEELVAHRIQNGIPTKINEVLNMLGKKYELE